MLDDSFDVTSFSEGLKGHVTVELFDAETGELVDKQENNNFIANHGKEFLKYQQRIKFKDQVSVLGPGGADTDYGTYNVFDRIVLTDSVKTEDSVNEWYLPGNLIGYSEKSTYSGADTLRGTPNGGLCENTETYAKWVFDWPTHAANGTIGSVGWHHDEVTGGFEPVDQLIFIPTTLTTNTPISVTPGYTARRPDGRIFVLAGSTVTAYNSSYISTGSFGTSAGLGICWDEAGSRLWHISGTQLTAYDGTGSIVAGPLAITARSYVGLTFDGTDLWTTASSSAYKISTAGTDISNFPIDMTTNTTGAWATNPSPPIIHDIVYSPTDSKLYFIFRLAGSSYAQNNNFMASKVYDTTGNKTDMWVSIVPFYNNTHRTANNFVVGTGFFDIINESTFLFVGNLGTGFPNGNIAGTIRMDGMGSRALLPSPIVKGNTQTLRITYRVDYP